MVILVSSFGRAINSGQRRILAVNHVGHVGSMMEVDAACGQKFLKGINPRVGTPWPKDDVAVLAMEHHHVSGESVDKSSQLREGDVLTTGNKGEDGVFHLLENDERVHPYQRRRTSITGFRL